MDSYEQIHRLFRDIDTDHLREHRDYLEVFPPVDSKVALEHWQEARESFDRELKQAQEVLSYSPELADVATIATRDQAFVALDLYKKHDRAVNSLILDVDETLRSAGKTDNEIPRETLRLLRTFHEDGIPIVICTGQTLENVKGFLIQGLGSEIVHSGNVSIVYEAGTAVFTPGHGAQTKQLLYQELKDETRAAFDEIRTRVLPNAPDEIRRGCHLQGNEFNITLKPNFETGTDRAEAVIDQGLVYLLELLGDAVSSDPMAADWTKAHYAELDSEIEAVLANQDVSPSCSVDDIPEPVETQLNGIDVAYYHADAAEVGSLELNKVAGVEAALEVLDVEDPFSVVMGDSKTDLRVMQWAEEQGYGIGAAPTHASQAVVEYVEQAEDLLYAPGDSGAILRTILALNQMAALEADPDSTRSGAPARSLQ